jgi:uncharacterized protein (TIGR03435 family)
MRCFGPLAMAAFALSAQAPLSFEVASIKPHGGPRPRMLDFSSSGPRATLEAYDLLGLVMEAYHLPFDRIVFAASVPPRQEDYYDIAAKAPGSAAPTRDEFRRMLQSLLAERFQFQCHRELREMPVYVLVVGKGGPKFHDSKANAGEMRVINVRGRTQTLTAPQCTMALLAEDLSSTFGVDRPVIDRTGLAGTYEIRFEATPGWRINNNPELTDIPVATALQEQLGLKLQAQKEKLEILVIDHMEKPTAN